MLLMQFKLIFSLINIGHCEQKDVYHLAFQQSYLSKINTRGKQALKHVVIASANYVTTVRNNT